MSNISQESISGKVREPFVMLEVRHSLCGRWIKCPCRCVCVCVDEMCVFVLVFCLAQLPVSAACSLNVGLKPALMPRRLWLLLWEYLPLSS